MIECRKRLPTSAIFITFDVSHIQLLAMTRKHKGRRPLKNRHGVYYRPTVLYKSTTYLIIMKLFCETRPIQVMGLIGHVFA